MSVRFCERIHERVLECEGGLQGILILFILGRLKFHIIEIIFAFL